MVMTYLPPVYSSSPMPAVSGFGPRSWYFFGSQVSKRCAGSITWSSTLMIRGSSVTSVTFCPLAHF